MNNKLLSCVLATVLVLSVRSTVSAAPVSQPGGTETNNVYGTYTPMADAETIYKVDVMWGSMEFTYNAGTIIKTWNPTTHSYDITPADEGTWSCVEDADKLTVTNHSNKALTATVAATINEAFSGVQATVTDGTISLLDASAGATTTNPGKPSTGSASIKLTGALTDTTATQTAIGKVTVTIADTE